MHPLFASVFSWFDNLAADPRKASRTDVETLRGRLQRQVASTHKARRTIAARESQLNELRTQIGVLRRQLDERRHNMLTQEVLRQLLPARTVSRPLLREDSVAAKDREGRLRETSAAYREEMMALASDGASNLRPLQRISLSGVPWWIPLDERVPDRPARAANQKFPLRAILQTREVSIGGVMLDLGANLGRTSIPRIWLGDVRAVYAAEPEPGNYACLVRNVVEHGLQGFVLPDRVAIGAAAGELQLHHSKYAGGHRLLHQQPKKQIPVVTVSVLPLDTWLDRLGVDPAAVSFVKVDTQGSEVAVLAGAGALLARRQAAWQMEVDPSLLQRAGTTVRELIEAVQQHFTHAIDIGAAAGHRIVPTAQLGDVLGRLEADAVKTDLILYNGASAPAQ